MGQVDREPVLGWHFVGADGHLLRLGGKGKRR